MSEPAILINCTCPIEFEDVQLKLFNLGYKWSSSGRRVITLVKSHPYIVVSEASLMRTGTVKGEYVCVSFDEFIDVRKRHPRLQDK